VTGNKRSGCDGVVNLAGEPIAEGRWTAERKQEISTAANWVRKNVTIAEANPKPSVLVNASAMATTALKPPL